MKKGLSFATVAALALSFAGCSGGGTTPAVSTSEVLVTGSSPVTASSTTTASFHVTGPIVAVISASKIEVNGGKGVGYLYIYLTSTTTKNYNGLSPAVGEYADAYGTGSAATYMTASQITLSKTAFSTTTSTSSPAPSTASWNLHVHGPVVGIKSTTEFEINGGSGVGYLNVYTTSTTVKNYNGLTLEAGDYADVYGNGSVSTYVTATQVTLSTTSSGSTTTTTTATPAPGSTTTTATPAPTATATPTTTTTAIKHITVIVMENNDYESIVGNSSAPYLNNLITRTAFFTNSEGVTHPSEPNYLALFSGSTQGLTSDACPVSYSGANLATQLTGAGYSFAGYAENMPSTLSACEADPSPYGSGYYYMRKHVPWADFTNVPSSEYHTWNGPGTALAGSVNFITPNMCDDMHDCSTATGDTWLSKNVPAIESWDNANNGLLIVTFDEGEYSSTNHIYTAFDGPMIKAGKYSQSINHYNVLRFIEDNFHLAHLGNAGGVTAISGILK